MTRGLRHLALRTRDLGRTERFYLDVLGLKTAFPHEGMIFLETPGGHDLLNFVESRRAFELPQLRKDVQAVDSAEGPEVEQDQLAAQVAEGERAPGVEPVGVGREIGCVDPAGEPLRHPTRRGPYAGVWVNGRTA